MSNETKFMNGLIVKAPNEKAPEYIKARLSIKREEFISWLTQQDGEWINADIKVSQNGKWYAAVDEWKPQGGGQRNGGPAQQRNESRPANTAPARDDFADDDINF